MAPPRSRSATQRHGSAASEQLTPNTDDLAPAGERRIIDLEGMTEDELKTMLDEEAAKARKRKMIDQIMALRNGAPLEDVVESHGGTATPQPEPKRPRTDALIKQLAPIRYKGGNWNDLQDFLFKLEGRFNIAKDEFATDENKVWFAGASLEGNPARKWRNHVTLHYGGKIGDVSWAAMEAWLKNSVADDNTRAFSAAVELDEIKQKPGQSYQQFIDKYETVEAECPDPLPERQRVVHVLNRLLPDLRSYILARGLPATRQELDNAAKRAETLTKTYAKDILSDRPKLNQERRDRWAPTAALLAAAATPTVESEVQRSASASTPAASTPTPEPAVKKEERGTHPPPSRAWGSPTCFNCGKVGHMSAECTEEKCYKCGQPRHSGRRCAPAPTGVNSIQIP
ncbi:putative zinc knuckle domain-containing protein [Colletotrichum sublineola]|uniref:Putative zinc knuckle domain-containing protein n=1 Tax=Colletotrichum sublineola TaxID=1173701 RepID=A0A066XDV4_COLSU|nr:putative zinc knuckle domain-containing protein [Colletotrichum sublineola]